MENANLKGRDMKSIITKTLLAVVVIMLPQLSSAAKAFTVNKSTPLKTEEQKFSYILGVDLAENFTQQAVKLNPELVYLGLKAALTDKNYRLSEKEMKDTLKSFQVKMQAKRQKELQKLEAKLKVKAVENKKLSDNFLSKNKTKKNVTVTKSGLQYQVVKQGKGKTPTDDEFVVVEYTGKLVDGTVFDSTDKHGQPASFPVNSVIQGWQEALKMMKVGAEWNIVVPYNLAYGETGQGTIGPNETLLFNVKLLKVQKNDVEPKPTR